MVHKWLIMVGTELKCIEMCLIVSDSRLQDGKVFLIACKRLNGPKMVHRMSIIVADDRDIIKIHWKCS